MDFSQLTTIQYAKISIFFTSILNAQSQDTIYLGEFGSGIVKNKLQATKYRIVTPDPMTNYQAIKLVMDMPKWSPAMQDGNPVKVKRTLPIALK